MFKPIWQTELKDDCDTVVYYNYDNFYVLQKSTVVESDSLEEEDTRFDKHAGNGDGFDWSKCQFWGLCDGLLEFTQDLWKGYISKFCTFRLERSQNQRTQIYTLIVIIRTLKK